MKIKKILLLFGCALIVRTAVAYRPVMVDIAIHFSVGSAVIWEKSYPILNDNVVAIMKRNPDIEIILNGHTDALESPKNTQALSLKRAQAAKDYLVSQGIDASRLHVRGYGATRPVASNDSEEGRQKNRRVDADTFYSLQVFAGFREMPVADLEKKFQKEFPEKNSYNLLLMARLHQVAYARQTTNLPVEIWNGEDYYAWAAGDPAKEKRVSTQNPLSQKVSSDLLEKAIHYFSEVIRLPKEPYIGGLTDYPSLRKINAYRGLIWCLAQNGQANKVQKVFSQYLKFVSQVRLPWYSTEEEFRQAAWQIVIPMLATDSELKSEFQRVERISASDFLQKRFGPAPLEKSNLMEKKADILFDFYLSRASEVFVGYEKGSDAPIFLGFVSGDDTPGSGSVQEHHHQLSEAIALYEKILIQGPTKSSRDNPADDRSLILKRKLTRARAQRATKDQTILMYEELLDESLLWDEQLSRIPGEKSNTSLQVWYDMQSFLDPAEDANFIRETQAKLKNAKLKAKVIPPYGVNLRP